MRVAQLDRASDYGSEGREFESSRARLPLDYLSKGFFYKRKISNYSAMHFGFTQLTAANKVKSSIWLGTLVL